MSEVVEENREIATIIEDSHAPINSHERSEDTGEEGEDSKEHDEDDSNDETLDEVDQVETTDVPEEKEGEVRDIARIDAESCDVTSARIEVHRSSVATNSSLQQVRPSAPASQHITLSSEHSPDIDDLMKYPIERLKIMREASAFQKNQVKIEYQKMKHESLVKKEESRLKKEFDVVE